MKTGKMLTTACGSPHYVAPEILTFDGTASYDGLLGDVWALGVILHVMLLYKLPFEADSTQLLYKKIRQGLPSLPASLSPAASSLLQGMLAVAPEKRTTLVQVVQHEWLQLQVTAQSQVVLSQTINAVIDFPSGGLEGSDRETFLSASNLFQHGSYCSSTTSDEGAVGGIRRAFSFDVLPPSSEGCSDDILRADWKGGLERTSRRGSNNTAPGALAFKTLRQTATASPPPDALPLHSARESALSPQLSRRR